MSKLAGKIQTLQRNEEVDISELTSAKGSSKANRSVFWFSMTVLVHMMPLPIYGYTGVIIAVHKINSSVQNLWLITMHKFVDLSEI